MFASKFNTLLCTKSSVLFRISEINQEAPHAMLKNISSVISPDLLWLLASMGHGDDLVLVDRNFPAIQVAKQTSTGRLIELPGLNIPQATRAILSLMPLDHFVEEPVTRMRVVDDP
jgi:L-fucose mutarotase